MTAWPGVRFLAAAWRKHDSNTILARDSASRSARIEQLHVTSRRGCNHFRRAKESAGIVNLVEAASVLTFRFATVAIMSLSDYCNSLDSVSKKRYIQKLSLFDGQDPYKLTKQDLSHCEAEYPDFK